MKETKDANDFQIINERFFINGVEIHHVYEYSIEAKAGECVPHVTISFAVAYDGHGINYGNIHDPAIGEEILKLLRQSQGNLEAHRLRV